MNTEDPWAATRESLNSLLERLESPETAHYTLEQLEQTIGEMGREVERQALQGRLHRQTQHEQHMEEVYDAQGVEHSHVEAQHVRTLGTVFGEVQFTRLAYRQRGHANLHPADAALQLPEESYSYSLRRLAAIEAARGSYGEAVERIACSTRAPKTELHKRQIEELAQRAAQDFDDFYAAAEPPAPAAEELLCMSCDGKGIVMIPDALRPATAKAAAKAGRKLATRLSKGEKPNRKRMAEVGAVFTVKPVPRTPEDILGPPGQKRRKLGPHASGKWVMASVVEDAAAVIGRVFDEAERRDPRHAATWLALVDGNRDQIRYIRAEARRRGVRVTILVDFIHVLEYIWGAAWCFFDASSATDAEAWVLAKGRALLAGDASLVAAAIRRKATTLKLKPDKRLSVDRCADYLLHKQPHLDYPSALRQGWPIATGVIEGTCRHLVKDRMDVTGARWGLQSAEAVLKLRALRTNGDFNRYWTYHLTREYQRVHAARYADATVPAAY